MGLGRREGLDERFVFPLDFACTDEWVLTPLPLDRFLPAQQRRDGSQTPRFRDRAASSAA